MKRKLLVIGIGAGDPDHVTVQAIKAMNRADVFFIPDKGQEKGELARVRLEILERHVERRPLRTVGYAVPRRRGEGGYGAAVDDWHTEIAAIFARLLSGNLQDGQTGAFLVWGDPALYDSTLRILDRLRAGGAFELDCEVIPGISSVQALTAAHGVALNAIGKAVMVTTGRSFPHPFPDGVDSVVVMLDAERALALAEDDAQVYWGACLGMPGEVLVAGKAGEVRDEIARRRGEARAERGWIMDTVLIRRS